MREGSDTAGENTYLLPSRHIWQYIHHLWLYGFQAEYKLRRSLLPLGHGCHKAPGSLAPFPPPASAFRSSLRRCQRRRSHGLKALRLGYDAFL